MGLKVEGMALVLADIQALAAAFVGDSPGFRSAAEEALTAAAQPVFEAAQRFVPTKSGALKRALKVGKVKARKGGGFRIDIGKTDKGEDGYYAMFVEFGHGGPHGPAAPHPFMRPAYDTTKDQAYAIIRARLEQEITKHGG